MFIDLYDQMDAIDAALEQIEEAKKKARHHVENDRILLKRYGNSLDHLRIDAPPYETVKNHREHAVLVVSETLTDYQPMKVKTLLIRTGLGYDLVKLALRQGLIDGWCTRVRPGYYQRAKGA